MKKSIFSFFCLSIVAFIVSCDPEPCKTVIRYTESDTVSIRLNQSITSFYDHEIIAKKFGADTIKYAGEENETLAKFTFSFDDVSHVLKKGDSTDLGDRYPGSDYNLVQVRCIAIDSENKTAELIIRNSLFMTDCSDW